MDPLRTTGEPSARRDACVRILAALAPALLSACKIEYTMEEFDELARKTEARTIQFEKEFSIYSPHDWIRTCEYADVVRKQRAEVFALFRIEHACPTVVQLHPNEGLGVKYSAVGDGLRVDSFSIEPHGGIHGWAPGNRIIIEVDPPRTVELADGRSIGSGFSASMFESTIRHELVHAALFLLGVEESNWLNEGLAHAVQSTPVENGRLRLDPSNELLRWAASLSHEQRSLERLLDWRQRLPPTDDDRRARWLAYSLVLFLLERDGAPSLRDGFERLVARDRSSLLSLESEWSAWLDRFATPAAMGGTPRSP